MPDPDVMISSEAERTYYCRESFSCCENDSNTVPKQKYPTHLVHRKGLGWTKNHFGCINNWLFLVNQLIIKMARLQMAKKFQVI